MKTRIKELRKALNMTQQEFASSLGVSRNNIAGYESGNTNPGDSAVSLICAKHNVNEKWLRTGEGEMFNELSEAEETAAFLGRIMRKDMDHDVRRKLIHALSRMTDEQLLVMTEMVKNLIDEFKDEKKD